MGKLRTALVVGLLAGATLTAEAQTETQLGDIYSRASSAMVVLKCAFRGQQANRSITGQAVCIDKAGTFLTFALDNRVRPEHIVRCRIVVPGHAGRNVAAKLLWTDAETGMAFIQASEAHNWSAVKFVRNANLAVGQKVFSVGLMPNDPSHAPCVAVAYVSAVLRVPELLVYVTGGKLTGVGSPVFTADGRAVGLVGRQPFLSHQLAANRKFTEVGLKNRQESAFFTPADEFAHVLEHPGRRKLPWFGALSVQGVGFTPEDAEIRRLDHPGLMIDQITPDSPAIKAGLKDRDIITALDGQPLELLATPELTARNFQRMLFRKKPGDQIKLAVVRGDQKMNVTLTLSAMPPRPSEAPTYQNAGLGLAVREKVLLDQYLDKSPTANVPGLIVIFVRRGGPAERDNLKLYDVITTVNGQPVSTVGVFRQIIGAAMEKKPGEAVNLLVRRGEQVQAISIQPPRAPPAPGGIGE